MSVRTAFFGASLLAVALFGAVACGGSDSETSAPTGNAGGPAIATYNGGYPQLADGHYLEELPAVPSQTFIFGVFDLEQIAPRADAFAVVKIEGVKSEIIQTPAPGQFTPMDRSRQVLPWTTYDAHIEQWIKGDGDADTTISIVGGLDFDGPRIYEGTFIPQAGRTYVMPLFKNVQGKTSPADGEWQGAAAGPSCVEVTDGFVHLFNDQTTQDALSAYKGKSVDEIVSLVKTWAAATIPTNAPLPTPSP